MTGVSLTSSNLTKSVNEKIGPVAQFANRKKKRAAIKNSDLQGAIARRMGAKK